MSTYTYAPGSVLSMTPASGSVTLTNAHGRTTTYPLIGWAVVVRSVEWDDDGDARVETAVEPVMLADGSPLTLFELGRGLSETGAKLADYLALSCYRVELS